MPAPHALAAIGSKLARLGIATKIGLGASLTAAGILAAGTAGALPAPADNAVRHAIAAVTPLETDAPRDEEPQNFGQQASTDATGETDRNNGVNGPSTAASAPGAEHRTDSAAPDEPPGQTGDTGLTRANQTPATPHAPDSPPSTEPTAGAPTGPGADHPTPSDPPASVPAASTGGEHRPSE